MNEELIVSHVTQCAEALEDIKQAFVDKESDEDLLFALFQHAYHHLNFAWNSRNCELYEDADKHYQEFERFPAVFQELLGADAAGGRGVVIGENETSI
jgi:hypothetical protein